jgi:hypothetical protein
MIGPLFAAAFMVMEGPKALFLFAAITQATLAGFVFYRTRVQASLTPPEKTEFDLATTASVGAVVTPEAPDPADPSVAVPEPYPPPPEEPAVQAANAQEGNKPRAD